ncbi:hypothetical protein VIGAN_08320800, partial [Vigna angularis var. angularis]
NCPFGKLRCGFFPAGVYGQYHENKLLTTLSVASITRMTSRQYCGFAEKLSGDRCGAYPRAVLPAPFNSHSVSPNFS